MLFVYPSVAETGEALPVAPLEAMANGCAPLVSNLRCFRDYIEDGVNGFVFDHRGENAQKTLAERLEAVLQLGADKLLQIGDAARAKAAEFAIEPVAKRYLDDFASLLKARSPHTNATKTSHPERSEGPHKQPPG